MPTARPLALITGASSSIGYELTREFAQNGYDVIMAADHKGRLKEAAQGIREDLKDTGITVMALMPGPTDTNFFHRAGMERAKVMDMKKSDPAEVAREAYAALMRGDDHTVVGLKNKIQVAASKMASDLMKAKMTGKMTGPK